MQQLIPLLGNHDLMMLEARTDAAKEQFWRAGGGDATLKSYAKLGEMGTFADVPQHHWDFLEHWCLNWYEIDPKLSLH